METKRPKRYSTSDTQRFPDAEWVLATDCDDVCRRADTYRAALAAPPAAPPADLVALGERLRTQDNQITAHPIFVVEHRDDRWRPWEFVTACLTDEGAQAYMHANGHNLRKFSRVFVHSGYRNDQWIGLRNSLMALAAPRVPETPQGDGEPREWLIVDGRTDQFWGPNRGGYFGLWGSGLYTEAEAKRIAGNKCETRRDRAHHITEYRDQIANMRGAFERLSSALAAAEARAAAPTHPPQETP